MDYLKYLNPNTWVNELIKSLCSLIKAAFMNIYEISFFILIVLCMYYIIQAMCGSNKGKIGVISTIVMSAIIEIVKTMVIGV